MANPLAHIHIRTYDTTCPRTDPLPSLQEGSLTIRPVLQSSDSSFGAEIFGVDWKKPVPDELVKQVDLLRYH